ncbi:MAG: hypothetical protein M1820_007102 [Bogoriella megaspora]|nr:MAG: hypothetical protein M1820_007102 [Bogoriella megaspora]
MLEAVVDAFPDGYYRESIVGVEVVGKSISSLPENMQEYVPGTWSTCRLAENAIVWLFVYPRDPGLLLKYLSEFGERAVERIVWLGPNADWPDYDEILREWGDAQIVRESGLVAYETMCERKASNII